MKFVLAKTHRYWWPVTIRVPDPENAGAFLEQKLRVQFEPLPRDEALAMQEEGAKLKSLREMTDHEIGQFRQVVRNWDGVEDQDGNVVPFSPDLLVQALQQSWFRDGLSAALKESLNGEAPRLGN